MEVSKAEILQILVNSKEKLKLKTKAFNSKIEATILQFFELDRSDLSEKQEEILSEAAENFRTEVKVRRDKWKNYDYIFTNCKVRFI